MSKGQDFIGDTSKTEAEEAFAVLFPNLFEFVRLLKSNPELNLSQAFPSLTKKDLIALGLIKKEGVKRTDFPAEFKKIHGCLSEYSDKYHNKKLIYLGIYDLAKGKKQLNKKLLGYLSSRYPHKVSLSCQKSIINRLISAELILMVKGSKLDSRAAALGVLDVDKLQPHLKRLWELMPREGGRNTGIDSVKRLTLPLTELSGNIFSVLQNINDRFKTTDVESLLITHHQDIAHAIRSSNIEHKDRAYGLEILTNCREALGLKLPKPLRALTEEQLPEKMRCQLEVFEGGASRGLGAFDDLRVLAVRDKINTNPFRDTTVRVYKRAFLIGASHIDLNDSMGVEDLLVLESRSIERNGKIVGEELFNPYFKKYQDEERARVKPGIKEAGFDTTMISHFAEALCSIARFNGEFYLPARFRQYTKIRLDYSTRKDRKHRKKQRMTMTWIDGEINRLKERFDRIVTEKSFLNNKEDLLVCVFLVQLVVLRFLGFRQQCLRRCVISKNIIFNSDGSITFHFNRNEIKNNVMIHETLSRELHGDFGEIMLLIDVLEKYHYRVLKPIRLAFPELYRTHVGEAFFVSVPCAGEEHLIQRYPIEREGDAPDDRAKTNTRSAGRLRTIFETAAYALMDFEQFKDLDLHFNPHYLRAICCDWMRKVLGWTWEEISKAMGDSERTLRNDYFDEDARIQDATDFFTRTSKVRKSERVEREKEAAFVPVNLFQMVQKNLELNTANLVEQSALRKTAEDKVATLEGHVSFLLKRCDLSPDKLEELIKEESAHLASAA